jgi:hypothetical protein
VSVARASSAYRGSVHQAETLWYDTGRWSAWIDGLERVISVEGDWPEPGATVVWESGPAGRGRVTERVTGHKQLEGQTLSVQDDSITGTQTVTFTPVGDDGVDIELTLDYRITKRSIFMPVVDLLFVRGAMRSSLRATLSRFGLELDAALSKERPTA